MVTLRQLQDDARSTAHRELSNRPFDVLLRCFAISVGADTATLFTRDEPGGTHIAATWRRDGRTISAAPATPDALVERALAGNGDGALVESALDAGGHRHRAVAAAFSSNERVLGAIHAGFESPSSKSDSQLVWAADSYARLAAFSMSRETPREPAGYDALTGCLDPARVDEVLRGEIERSRRRGHRLSCCMIDLDGFERINDKLGPVEGDYVLAAVGAALRGGTRRYDAVGRRGGDEFMIVLPETGGDERRRIGERFRTAIRSGVAEAPGIQIDASVGVVEWDGEESADDLVRAADRSMRMARARGGGRVEADEVREPGDGDGDGLVEITRHLIRPFS
jgi:diguanylate cyclase (GGDEF)-like protein